MNKKLIILTAVCFPALLALVRSTWAEPSEIDIAGFYRAEGKGAYGKTYEGDVWITKKKDAYKIDWHLKTGDNYTGVGVRQGDCLAVAYQASPGNCGVGLYHITSKSTLIGPVITLTGRWATEDGKGDVKTEVLTSDVPE